jgi:transcriptional regulator with XRE-family HTH domain
MIVSILTAKNVRMLTMKIFEERARAARKNSGLNQSEAARKIGISREAVSQWENGGTKTINSVHLFPTARAYGVSAEWLASGAGDMLTQDHLLLSGKNKLILNHLNQMSESAKDDLVVMLFGIAASKTQG